MGFLNSFFGGGAEREARRARREAERIERERQNAIDLGTRQVRERFDQTFTDDFYNNLRASLENYYLPQINRQFEGANREALFAMTRTGNRNSSARAAAEGRIKGRFDTARQDVAAQGQGLVDQRRREVGGALESAIMQINAAENPLAAAELGANSARLQTFQPQFSPLGQVFTDLTSALATQSVLTDRGENRYSTPRWLNWATSSGRQVGG